MSNEEKAQQLISIFVCNKDPDIESFLKNKAIMFEKAGKSRTFFIFDEDESDFQILAYYTIAIRVLKIPDELLSVGKTQKLDGYSGKFRNQKITEFPTILIGQFAKNDLFIDKINGSEMMQYCLNTIYDGQKKLGGRIIMLECKDNIKLLKFYNNYGFEKLDKDYSDGELLQLIRVLHEDEIIEVE